MKPRVWIAFPLLLGIGGAAVLCALGFWQIHRLQWKQGVLAEIEARIVDPAVPLPLSPRRDMDNFLPVTAAGEIQDGELFVLLSRRGSGPGFRVIAPFETAGRKILLDRGFVPEAGRGAERGGGPVRVIGNLHWPDEIDTLFTPDPNGDLWFARDVEAMAAVLGTESVLLVVRESDPPAPGIDPWPVDGNGIPNNHLNYAVTWFLMAAAWFGMTGLWIRRISREPQA